MTTHEFDRYAPVAAALADPGQTLALAHGLLERDPARVIERLVTHVLTLAETWTVWNGQTCAVDDRVYTPHKAIRRVSDHLIDHLAEVEARLAGVEPLPDRWHASAVTTPADLAPFTAEDLDEARSRLTRLAAIWTKRLHDLSPQELDAPRGDGWTLRAIATHLDGSRYYADAIGALS